MEEKTSSMGLAPNVGGLLCYVLGWITGLVFFLLEKEDEFVRFHAMQSMITFGVIHVISLVVWVIPLIGVIISYLISLVSLVLWIILMIKAYQGEKFKLPVIGDLAEEYSK